MNFQTLINMALAEDIGSGDVTTQALIPEGLHVRMALVAREPLVMAAGEAAAQTFRTLDASIDAEIAVKDGERAAAGQPLVVLHGPARPLLSAERVALNLLQRACGIATATRAFVEAVTGTHAAILDTRKTMPGVRSLDKYAVRCGGGVNHRFGLYDAALIKDNHIALCGGIAQAVARLRAQAPVPVIVECDTLAQVEDALAARPDRILLDNMTPEEMRRAVALARGRVKMEASGGITLANARAIAETGVDFLSVGALTHSVKAADIGADIQMEE
ncbi:MAG: carboxylating nicotinate-nucleotide diphosphorylase [Alphaproteobacteria bacterium]|nr:carboxylating nicotinate-nucleotide diphosphorylase [Alphaproteobacteria bacterium]